EIVATVHGVEDRDLDRAQVADQKGRAGRDTDLERGLVAPGTAERGMQDGTHVGIVPRISFGRGSSSTGCPQAPAVDVSSGGLSEDPVEVRGARRTGGFGHPRALVVDDDLAGGLPLG